MSNLNDIYSVGDISLSGEYSLTLTVTGNTNVTLPTSGTLATTDSVGKLIIEDSGYGLDNGSVGRGTVGIKSVSLEYSTGGTDWGAIGDYSTCLGGLSNQAQSDYSTISGGTTNQTSSTHNYATIGGGNNNIASGINEYGTLSGGFGNEVSASSAAITGGYENIASSDYSTITGGRFARTYLYGECAMASGRFSSTGDCQRGSVQFRISTSSTSETELFLDGSTERFTLGDNDAYTCRITIFGAQADGSIGEVVYQIKIKRQGTTTSLSQSLQTILAWNGDTNLGTPTFAITADDTNDALAIKVTPANTTATRWTAVLEYVKINY